MTILAQTTAYHPTAPMSSRGATKSESYALRRPAEDVKREVVATTSVLPRRGLLQLWGGQLAQPLLSRVCVLPG
jgi:hypothetical protein